MVDVLDDLAGDDVRELLQVQDVPRGLIDLAGHHDLEHVIVAVQIRALPEYPLILII
jgi:hypothetical protein